MGEELPRIDYKRNVRNTGRSAVVALIAGAALVVLMRSFPGGTKFFFGLLAMAALAIAVRSAWMARPLVDLSLSSEGLMYRMFSDKTAPWSELTAVTVIRTELLQVRGGKSTWAHQRQLDRINFAVADPGRYSKGPGKAIARAVQGMGGDPPIAIETWFLVGTTEEIADAIRARWSGTVAEKTLQSRG